MTFSKEFWAGVFSTMALVTVGLVGNVNIVIWPAAFLAVLTAAQWWRDKRRPPPLNTLTGLKIGLIRRSRPGGIVMAIDGRRRWRCRIPQNLTAASGDGDVTIAGSGDPRSPSPSRIFDR